MDYKDLVNNHTEELIERLLGFILSEDYIEIHYDFNDDSEWAIVSMHVYEDDQQISLRQHPADVCDLYFGYYDDNDDFFEIVKPLSEEEKKLIPPALRKLLKSVVEKEEGVRVPANFLSRVK